MTKMHGARVFVGRRITAAVFATTAAVGLLTSSAAKAEFIGELVTVQLSNSQGSAVAALNLPPLPDPASDTADWKLSNALEVRNQAGILLGTLKSLEVHLEGDPAVELIFAVTAGNVDTTFTITSASVSFSTLNDPLALASAGVTLTDGSLLPGNGASLDLIPPDTGLYKAEYNGDAVFAALVGSQSLGGAGTVSASSSSGVQTISGPVSSIQASYQFKLSAKDSASGSSRFEVLVPEPSSFLLLLAAAGAFGLLVIASRFR